jgi:Leucine-rich repeat (LRR) protein
MNFGRNYLFRVVISVVLYLTLSASIGLTSELIDPKQVKKGILTHHAYLRKTAEESDTISLPVCDSVEFLTGKFWKIIHFSVTPKVGDRYDYEDSCLTDLIYFGGGMTWSMSVTVKNALGGSKNMCIPDRYSGPMVGEWHTDSPSSFSFTYSDLIGSYQITSLSANTLTITGKNHTIGIVCKAKPPLGKTLEDLYEKYAYYKDTDRDGFGVDSTRVFSCIPVPGAVQKIGDCDDADDEIYPGAKEICDNKDNDCNGQIDEVDCDPTVPASDSLALVDLYNSTNGLNWISRTNWLTDKVNTWFGVTVAGGRVTELSLTHNRLFGSIPSSLGNLTALQSLDLYDNQLSGSIPSEVGNLTALQFLNLNTNQLRDAIPARLGRLSVLSKLDLSNNQLGGSIPNELGSLITLEFLDLSSNQLLNGIPIELGNLAALQTLALNNNQLFGSIPSGLENLTSLKSLILFGNQLNGIIPASLGNLSALNQLDLSYNQIKGNVPSSFGKLAALQYLYLNNNHLSGSFPGELGNLPVLQDILLHNNQFANLPTFNASPTTFDVSNNLLTFESLESNINKFKNNTDYAPQDSVRTVENLILFAGKSLSLSAFVGGSKNLYQWTRDGVDIFGATNESLTVTAEGAYSCKITNTVVTGLTLYRRRINVASFGTRTVLESDSLALVDLYNSTKGTNWKTKANWLTGSVNTWFGVTITGGG